MLSIRTYLTINDLEGCTYLNKKLTYENDIINRNLNEREKKIC